MHKNQSVLEVEISNKKFEFKCDVDSPLGAVHDALCQMKFYVLDQMKKHQEMDEKSQEKMREKPQECSSC